MEAIKGLVKQVIEKLQENKIDLKQQILSAWQKGLSGEYRQHSKIINFRQGHLIVNIDSSSWVYQLSLEKECLIKKLNKRLKNPIIKDIYFRIGDI